MFCLCPVPAKVAGEGRGELDSRVSVDGLEMVTPFKHGHYLVSIFNFWGVSLSEVLSIYNKKS